MRYRLLLGAVLAIVASVSAAFAADGPSFNQVKPGTFDPAHTFLVQATWLSGIGCPTGAKTFDGTTTSTYTDPACPTGDPKDNHNQGLLLAKTGPTANFAAAQAQLKDVPSKVTELGYDLRKPGMNVTDPRGSHCGGGAPRFNIETSDGKTWFIGCNSVLLAMTTPGNGWMRLRWDGSTPAFPQLGGPTAALNTLDVKRIDIIFDEGQDASGAPDQFGLAVLDNIDVNKTLVGRGPRSDDKDNGNRNKDGTDKKDKG